MKYVIDTNLYVEAIRTDEGNQALADFQRGLSPLIFQHSTIAQEILAGAGDEGIYRQYYRAWIEPFEDLSRMLTPSHQSWTRAALIMTRLVEHGRMSPGGFSRSFLNDCLIAASAREHGFLLVTRNTADFELISKVEVGFRFEVPWPKPE